MLIVLLFRLALFDRQTSQFPSRRCFLSIDLSRVFCSSSGPGQGLSSNVRAVSLSEVSSRALAIPDTLPNVCLALYVGFRNGSVAALSLVYTH